MAYSVHNQSEIDRCKDLTFRVKTGKKETAGAE